MHPLKYRPSLLSLSAVVALLGPGLANAALLIGAGSAASANNVAATPATFTQSLPPYVNSSSSLSSAAGNGQGFAFANGNGAYAVSSSAEGIGSGAANASFRETFLNFTGVRQHYSLSFYIYGGSIGTTIADGATLTGTERLRSSYSASVKVNNVSVFSSSAFVERTAGSITHGKTGTDLNINDTGSDGFYSWGGNYYTVDLGVVASGDLIAVVAEVDDMAFADVGTYSFTGGGGENGGYGCNTDGNVESRNSETQSCQGFKGSAGAFYGDPLGLSGQPDATLNPAPFAVTNTPANGVPEPGSIALIGVALGAAALASRRRRRTA